MVVTVSTYWRNTLAYKIMSREFLQKHDFRVEKILNLIGNILGHGGGGGGGYGHRGYGHGGGGYGHRGYGYGMKTWKFVSL